MSESTHETPRLSEILLGRTPVIPVLHVESPDHAEPLLAALVDGGISVVEVTLRSSCAFEVITRMRAMGTNTLIGAGTVTRASQFAEAHDAGAMFAVSPALTKELADAAASVGLPYLPGVCTPSEALRARESGFVELKFFPADLMGGIGWLNHIHPLYPELAFCPTGGINAENARDYLAQQNVFTIGGASVAAREAIAKEDWHGISDRSRTVVERVG